MNPYAAAPTARPPGYLTYRHTASGAWYSGRNARRYPGLRVWLHPDHGRLLCELAANTGLTLVWASTWQHEANTWIAPAIGLPPLPVIEFPPEDLRPDHSWRPNGSWKWPAVLEFASGRPLAWLDDEHMSSTHGDGRAAFELDRAGAPTFLYHVDPRHGLQTSHLAAIRDWAAALDTPTRS